MLLMGTIAYAKTPYLTLSDRTAYLYRINLT
jgi:hypothetical protein